MRNKVSPSKVYTLRRGRRSVFINDYEYPLLCTPDCATLPAMEVQVQEDIPHASASWNNGSAMQKPIAATG